MDFGTGLLRAGDDMPGRDYWVAFVDDLGRLCRVNHIRKDEEGESTETWYEYFCEPSGRVSQKRSYGGGGDLHLLVDYSYSDDGWVTERAHWIDGTTKSRRRKVEFHRMYGADD